MGLGKSELIGQQLVTNFKAWPPAPPSYTKPKYFMRTWASLARKVLMFSCHTPETLQELLLMLPRIGVELPTILLTSVCDMRIPPAVTERHS